MPPKGNRARVNQKADLADKVREIKQRQETWFKERQQQKSRSSPTEGFHSPAPPRAIVRQTHTIRKGGDPSQSPVPRSSNTTSPDPLARRPGGFHTYLKNKETNNNNNSSLASSSDDLPVADSTSPADRLLSRSHQRSLSPEMFDALADQIIHKVKRELKMDSDGGGSNSSRSQNSGVSEGQNEVREGAAQRLPSHHCQICSQVMLAPDCSPQLLIPCGHTFCAACVSAQSGSCPACRTPVQTVTPNLMLQQVIAEYQGGAPGRGTVPNPSKRSGSRTPQPKPRDYVGEYDTLQVRCEVLAAEAEDIHGRMVEIEAQVEEKLRQAEQVREQEQLIDEQIEQLREEQRALAAERDGFVEESELLRDTLREQEGQMSMVTNTMRGLRKDMDKTIPTKRGERGLVSTRVPFQTRVQAPNGRTMVWTGTSVDPDPSSFPSRSDA